MYHDKVVTLNRRAAGQGMILPVINIDTGYQIGLIWSSPLTPGYQIGLIWSSPLTTGYQNRPSRLWRTTCLSQDHMPIVFYDRPAIRAEARTFFFFFFLLVSSAPPIRQGYPRCAILPWLNRVCNAFECF